MKNKILSVAVTSIFGLSGCGGGGGGSTSTDDTLTGTFVDAPVQGLNYSTATQSGLTDSNGNFKYKSGETVTFKLGTLTLGSVTAEDVINPLHLAGDTSFSSISTKAKNIAMLLQNLDQNRSDTSKIIISSALKDHNFSAIDLTSATLEASMNALLGNSTISNNIDSNNTLIPQSTANSVMKNYLLNYTAGQYNGTFTLTNQIIAKNLFECSNSGSLSMLLNNTGSGYSMTSVFEIAPSISATVNYSTDSIKNVTLTDNANSPFSDYSVTISDLSISGKTIKGNYTFKNNGFSLCSGTYTLSK